MQIDIRLSDEELIGRVSSVALSGRRNLVELLSLLIDLEERKLHLAQGHASLFGFCCEVLRFSEGEASNRVAAVHAARRFPVVLELLRSGEINLTTVRLLAPHLDDANHGEVLRSACGKKRSQVEELVVALAPRPIPGPTLRAIPAAAVTPASVRPVPVMPAPVMPAARLQPVAPELFRLTVPMDAETRQQWERLRELVKGDDAQVFARAVAAAVAELERSKRAAVDSPRVSKPTGEHSRHIPADVKRKVEARDGGQCAFRGTERRCAERRNLEFHHVVAWMAGGPTTVENIELRCGVHNRYEADVFYASGRAGVVLERGGRA